MPVAALRRGDAPAVRADTLPSPYLLLLGDVTEPGYAKTAFGLCDWTAKRSVGGMGAGERGGHHQVARPILLESRGARAMVIGVANPGGTIPAAWLGALRGALEAGLDLILGMHSRLADLPGLAAVAERNERRLVDVRVPPTGIPVGTGATCSGKRLLTVGTDCALGKKYTALALARDLTARGVEATFRATGQIVS